MDTGSAFLYQFKQKLSLVGIVPTRDICSYSISESYIIIMKYNIVRRGYYTWIIYRKAGDEYEQSEQRTSVP